MPSSTVLAISPHLDDAAFSAGGTLARLARGGAHVAVATVFTRSVAGPTGFALRCQTDKGVAADADYLAIRRAEDAAACAALGAQALWLDLPEAPHRGYTSPEMLFAGAHAADAGAWRDVAMALRPLLAAEAPDLVLTCQGLGYHADHLHVVRAVSVLAGEQSLAVAWWRDAPYAMRAPEAPPAPGVPPGLAEHAVALTEADLDAKRHACAAYATQLPYQFGRDSAGPPEAAMRARVTAFAQAEAVRLGTEGVAEAFLITAEDARRYFVAK